jgi:hypothetical protein
MVSVEVAERSEVIGILRGAQTDKTDPQRLFSVDSMVGRGTCWKVLDGGAIVGALLTSEDSGVLWVLIAAGRSEYDLVEVMASFLAEQAKGRYTEIRFRTARRGLVRKAERHGYEVDAYIVKKKL